ncbi:hypothetical protein CBER1_01827 [Cercospora berteroae]|uniref:Uncharacterized protein n=1 Tax=Cercospora berteroae TaxID=357750 RepID=A0A2S6CA68_9PEZI|nr:hypothetical protein CBER1_01827 [Cercospora berteroae]
MSPDQEEQRGRAVAPRPATEGGHNPEHIGVFHSWVLPDSAAISPPERAASPSTASSASDSSSSSSGGTPSTPLSSRFKFIDEEVRKLRETPRPVLPCPVANLRPQGVECRVSAWMLDVEAQRARSGGKGWRGNLFWKAREPSRETAQKVPNEEAAGIAPIKGYGTMAAAVAMAREDWSVTARDDEEEEFVEEEGPWKGFGSWWQWAMFTISLLMLIAWGLWVLMGNTPVSKRGSFPLVWVT